MVDISQNIILVVCTTITLVVNERRSAGGIVDALETAISSYRVHGTVFYSV
jgi:hypothetical protein